MTSTVKRRTTMGKRTAIVCCVIVSVLALLVAGCRAAAAPTAAPEFLPGQPARMPSESGGLVGGRAESATYDTASAAVVTADMERLIIRTASLDLVVADTQTAMDGITGLVDELGGYVVESNVYQYQEGLQATLTLRIPAEKLDLALERFRGLATEVRSEHITGQDVTEEYVDLQSYLRNREAVQARLLEYLQEARTTEDALAVDTQLRQIEAEIEQTKGRMQYLEQSAALATVTLTLTPDALAQPIQVGGWHPEGTLRNALQSLIRVMQFLVDAAIVIVVLILPTLIVIAVPFVGLFFLIRFLVRRRRARKVSQVQ
jgi:hypothetical protein